MFEYGKDGPRAILVGVDGSETSLNAMALAIGAARRQRAELIVVFVWPFRGAALDPYGLDNVLAQQTADEFATWLRSTLLQSAAEIGLRTTVEIRHGDPCQQLLASARAHQVDQIYVGASTRLAHRFIGAVGSRLSRRSPAPLTVVP